VPQVDGNAKLKARIRSGEISQGRAMQLERAALKTLREYDRGEVDLEVALEALVAYSSVWDSKADRSSQYRETLEAKPWQSCDCSICKTVGIEAIIFRGAERNKRRGFHNLHVFGQRLRRQLGDDDRE